MISYPHQSYKNGRVCSLLSSQALFRWGWYIFYLYVSYRLWAQTVKVNKYYSEWHIKQCKRNFSKKNAEQLQVLAKTYRKIHDTVSEGPNGWLWECIHYIYIYTTLWYDYIPGQSLHGTTVPELVTILKVRYIVQEGSS